MLQRCDGVSLASALVCAWASLSLSCSICYSVSRLERLGLRDALASLPCHLAEHILRHSQLIPDLKSPCAAPKGPLTSGLVTVVRPPILVHAIGVDRRLRHPDTAMSTHPRYLSLVRLHPPKLALAQSRLLCRLPKICVSC